MSENEYTQFNSMRSTIKTLVKAQLLAKDTDGKCDTWLNDNKYLLNQMVDDAARAIVDKRGKPTRKQHVMLSTARNIVKLITTGYSNRFIC